MPKYKVQLHPDSAPFTVNSREDLDFILAFYKRMRAAQAVAYPYFIYPQKIPSPERVKKGVGFPPLPAIVAKDAEGEHCKSCYRFNLTFALGYLHKYEGDASCKVEDKLLPYEEEAESILCLIEEYNKLPEELPYIE